MWLNLDYEGGTTDTDLFPHQPVQLPPAAGAGAVPGIWRRWGLQANFAVLSNENPSLDIHYDLESRSNSVSAYWTPAGGKRISLMAEYSRSTLNSTIDYLRLPFLTPSISLYRENAHTGNIHARRRPAEGGRRGERN